MRDCMRGALDHRAVEINGILWRVGIWRSDFLDDDGRVAYHPGYMIQIFDPEDRVVHSIKFGIRPIDTAYPNWDKDEETTKFCSVNPYADTDRNRKDRIVIQVAHEGYEPLCLWLSLPTIAQ